MKNCLVETLKGTVDYKEFPRIGCLRVKVSETSEPSSTNSYIRIAYKDVAAKAEILGDGFFMRDFGGENKGSQQTASLYGETYEMLDTYISEGAFDIEYEDKYKLRFIGTGSNGRRFGVNIEDLEYCSNLAYIELNDSNVMGDIACLAKLQDLRNIILSYPTDAAKLYGNTVFFRYNFPDLTKVSFENTRVEGDLSDFSTCTSLTILNVQFSNVKGVISSLGPLVGLTTIGLSNKTEGTIESFVKAQRKAGRVTCNGISFPYLYSIEKVSFNGKPLIETVGTEYMSKLSWTENTITLKDSTINV